MNRYLFIAIFLLLLSGCLVRPNEKKVVYRLKQQPDSTHHNSILATESDSTQQALTRDTSVIQTTDTSEIVEESQNNNNHFHLIAASFINPENAKNFCNDLLSKGLNSRVIYVESTVSEASYKVAFASYPTKELAMQELNKQRKNGPFFDTWLMATKPTYNQPNH
jgi:hypothetical protein